MGRNFRGEFLIVTKCFQGGRRVSVMIHKGEEGKGWRSFGRAMEALLSSKGVVNVKGNNGISSLWG